MGLNEIKFDEGERHTVRILVPPQVNLTYYNPRIEVRRTPHSKVILTYAADDLTVSGQYVTLTVLPADTDGVAYGDFYWQLMLANKTDATDVIKFESDNFTIIPAITQKEATI